MNEFIRRLERRLRLMYLLCVGLLALCAYIWVHHPTETRGRSRAATAERSSNSEIDAIQARLRHAGYTERMRLLADLRRQGGRRGVEAIIDSLRNAPSDRARYAAIAELGRIGGPQAVDALAEVAEQASAPYVRRAAISALGEARAFDPLYALLQEAPGSLHETIVLAIGQTASDRAVTALQTLVADGHNALRETAIRALGATGQSKALDVLAPLLHKGTESERQACISAISNHGSGRARDLLLELAASADVQREQLMAIEGLRGYRDAVTEATLLKLANSEDQQVSRTALRVLGDEPLGEAARKAVDAALKSHDPYKRRVAINSLGDGKPESNRKLIELLDDPELGGEAAWMLARNETPQGKAALVKMAKRARSPRATQYLVSALGQMKGPDVEEALLQILQRGHPYSAGGALQALGKVQGKRYSQTLLQAYREGSPEVRRAALSALAERRDPRSTRLLTEAANSGESSTVSTAINGLVQSLGKRAAPLLSNLLKSGPPSARYQAAYALAQIGGDDARGALLSMLGQAGGDADSAANALQQMRDPQTRQKLRAMLANTSTDAETRLRLVRALGDDVDGLIAAADDPDSKVASRAIRSLSTQGDPRVEALLVRAANSPDEQRRDAAIYQLAQLATPQATATLRGALDQPATFKKAAEALSRVGDRQSLATLTTHFSGADRDGKRHLVQVLGDHRGHPRVRKLLQGALYEDDDEVVLSAANYLAQLGSSNDEPHLLGLLGEGHSHAVRRGVARSIKQADGNTYRHNRRLIDDILSAQPAASS